MKVLNGWHMISALFIARFGVQYHHYFPHFSYFAFSDLFHKPLGE